MIRTHIILCISLIAWCFGHSFFAAAVVKNGMIRLLHLSGRLYRLFYNIFALAGLAGCIVLLANTGTVKLFRSSIYTLIPSIFLLIAGTVIMLLCMKKYFRNMSGLYAAKAAEKLEMTGLHQYVRHPLYSGTFIFLAGSWGCFPFLSAALFAGIMIVYTLIGINFEELKLAEKFGKEYIRYRRRTPMIIPARKIKRKCQSLKY
jgi:methanethiol S-methyltransferase